MVKAKWSGSYPHLCRGTWTLIVNGINVTHCIPKEIRHSDMNTFGIYQTWYFDRGWHVVFENYEDGLHRDLWIKENKYWLDTITKDIDTQVEIFNAINEQDFRLKSCGGCI